MEVLKLNFLVNPNDVTDELILRRCKHLKDAVKLCRDCSPLGDKEIIDQIEKLADYKMQPSHFSECLNGGQRNFPPELIQTLENICHNWIPTRFMVLSRHHEMKPLKEALELENEALKTQIAKQQLEIEAITKFLKDINK